MSRTPGGITASELDVLRLLADGVRQVDIGRQLFISERTVKNRIEGARKALDARNTVHAVGRAYQLGLLGLDGTAEPLPISLALDTVAQALGYAITERDDA